MQENFYIRLHDENIQNNYSCHVAIQIQIYPEQWNYVKKLYAQTYFLIAIMLKLVDL